MNMKKLFFLFLVPLALTVSCVNKKSDPWKDLFNGKDFTGWEIKGGNAEYTIEDGQIVGTSKWDTPNTFLCTEDLYSDFILEFDVKVDTRLNSGVQFRSNSTPEYRNGRVHGYQCEIDPSERAWSGGIYDEARRGWLYPLSWNEEGRHAFNNNEWTSYRIEAIGNNIKTFINDIPVSNLFDEMTDKGFIGLQVHSIHDSSKIGAQVRWKNIRILTENVGEHAKETTAPVLNRLNNKLTETEKAEGWKLLFDGKTSEGWRGAHKDSFPSFGWNIHDGMITVLASGGAEAEHGGDIVTKEEYAAFDFQLEFKITEGANSGIKYFVTEKEDPSGSAHGLEFQILDDKRHPDAEKYTTYEGSRKLGSLYDLMPAGHKRFSGPGKWNLARVVVYPDNHVEHWLNGMKLLEYERGSEEYRELVSNSKYAAESYNEHGRFGEAEKGHILLQDHGDRVSFRSIRIKTLN
jgi:hypothetical protein